MKLSPVLGLLLVAACGEHDEELLEIGTARMGIVSPVFYGAEHPSAGGIECAANWQSDVCYVPDSKTFRIDFQDETCSAWWAARFAEVYFQMQSDVAPLGATITTGLDYRVRCEAHAWGSGIFIPDNDTDDHGVPNGTLKQFKGGRLLIDSVDAESTCTAWNLTSSECRRWARNFIRHEFLHMLGFGHTWTGDIMGAPFFDAPGGWEQFEYSIYTDPFRPWALGCYVPGSSTTPPSGC